MLIPRDSSLAGGVTLNLALTFPRQQNPAVGYSWPLTPLQSTPEKERQSLELARHYSTPYHVYFTMGG